MCLLDGVLRLGQHDHRLRAPPVIARRTIRWRAMAVSTRSAASSTQRRRWRCTALWLVGGQPPRRRLSGEPARRDLLRRPARCCWRSDLPVTAELLIARCGPGDLSLHLTCDATRGAVRTSRRGARRGSVGMKRALVTGGSGALGEAICRKLAAAGQHVMSMPTRPGPRRDGSRRRSPPAGDRLLSSLSTSPMHEAAEAALDRCAGRRGRSRSWSTMPASTMTR